MKSILASGALGLLMVLSGCGTRGEEVHFTNGDVTLAGTLLLPKSEGPVPAVVLIHGSGEQDRGSLRYYAKLFVRNGFAAVIYDKRGVGKSQGAPDAWRYFSFDSLAGDAAAAVTFLSKRDDIDAERIGIFGASQGGWVAPLAAMTSDRVAFMVVLSASVSTVAEDRLFERAARLKSEGFTESEIREVTEMQRVDQELSRSGQGFEQFAYLWDQHKEKRWFRRVYLGDEPAAADDEWRLWYRTVLDYDPVPLLEQLSIPMLWLFGDPAHDRFGPVGASVEQLDQLKQSGKEYETVVFYGADHNLRMVEGGKEAPFKAELSRWLAELPHAH
jgi:pimeloyl-ACP methyl ester carboxylesterase